MVVNLAYGRDALPVEIPDSNLAAVLNMNPVPHLADPAMTTREALLCPIDSQPLSELARVRKDACVVVSDITRPVPHDVILPPILQTLELNGITAEDITLLVATGLHEPMGEAQLRETLTDPIVDRYNVVNHVARNPDEQMYLGDTPAGIPAYVDRRYVHSDLKILTGLIESHFMAGYSGGRKLVAPGLVGTKTIELLHGPTVLEDPRAANGVLEGNPLHEASLSIARMAGADFIVNVAMDEERRVTGVFAGELEAAHLAGVAAVEQMVQVFLEEPVDIVITSSAGYPLDTTFYQAVKGMVGVLDILKQDGTIIIAASCMDGIGSKEFEELLRNTSDLGAFIHGIQQPGVFTIDQWEVEELIKALRKAHVLLYTDGLSPDDIRSCLVEPATSVESGISAALTRHGEDARIAVVPKGPYVMPRLAQRIHSAAE
ncbi:MAG: nickel-dependent lactate racemase [Candidatus Latescibacteria bacterium]|jgi:lactate racemase|nr:nickel-dependent lactate racemase [Candidatus Latescibacterota bacterium]